MTRTIPTPPLFLSHNGVNVYRTYKSRSPLIYWYTTDPRDWYAETFDYRRENRNGPIPDWLHKSQFDVRKLVDKIDPKKLPTNHGDDTHDDLIRAAIDAGLVPIEGGITA